MLEVLSLEFRFGFQGKLVDAEIREEVWNHERKPLEY